MQCFPTFFEPRRMFCILNSRRTPKQNMYGNEISSSFTLLAQYKTLTRLVEHKLEHLIAEGLGITVLIT